MNKIKIAGIAGGIILIVVAALFTALIISKKSNLYQSETAYEMPGGVSSTKDTLSAGISGMGLKEAPRQSIENLSTDSVPVAFEIDEKVIKNGDLTMKVDRVSDAQEKISEIAEKNGGSVFSSNITQSKNNVKSGIITVKVPVENFEKTFSEIKNVSALVIREATTGTDVTEEYQDLETQIRNKKAEEQSYVRILNQAQKVEDILAVTRQVSLVRGEIERLEGRKRFMDSQTNMSLINVSLSEDQDITVTDSWRPLQIAKEAVNSLVKLIQGFISFLIVLVVTFIPVAVLYFLVILVIYLFGRKIYHRFKKNKENNLPPS